MKQKDIAKLLNIHSSDVCRILAGDRKITLSLAKKLTQLFPYRDLLGWLDASPEQFKSAFDEDKFGSLLDTVQAMKNFKQGA